MKHKRFMWYWLALLACCSTVVGIMALFGIAGAEIIFWSRKPIESETGKIVWITFSALLVFLFWKLASQAPKNQCS